MKNKIVCLCGSTKFKKEFEQATIQQSLKNKIVLSVCCFTHFDKLKWNDKQLSIFHNLHMRKIEMADEIFVINPNNYIGETTKKEIEYAKSLGKNIIYMYKTQIFKEKKIDKRDK